MTDCGGTWGYREFLETIGHDHEEHAATLEWAGGHVDPDAFDPAEFDRRLRLGRLVAL